jgi:hypothetical protein
MPSKPDPSAQAHAWNQIDHHLVSLKLRQARKQIDKQFPVPVKISGAGYPFKKIMGTHLERARKWTETVYGIYTEVWEKQGKARTPDFLNAVLNRAILPAIGASKGDAKHEMELWAVRTGRPYGLGLVQQGVVTGASRLKDEWRTRIEIESREFELEQARFASHANHLSAVHGAPGQVAPVQESSKSNKAKRQSKSKAPRGSDPDIVKRREIVKQNRDLSAQGICRLFDERDIPLTKSVQEAGSWCKAFKAPLYRHSVESLISRDRKVTSG